MREREVTTAHAFTTVDEHENTAFRVPWQLPSEIKWGKFA